MHNWKALFAIIDFCSSDNNKSVQYVLTDWLAFSKSGLMRTPNYFGFGYMFVLEKKDEWLDALTQKIKYTLYSCNVEYMSLQPSSEVNWPSTLHNNSFSHGCCPFVRQTRLQKRWMNC